MQSQKENTPVSRVSNVTFKSNTICAGTKPKQKQTNFDKFVSDKEFDRKQWLTKKLVAPKEFD